MDVPLSEDRQRDALSVLLAEAGVDRRSAIRVAGGGGLAPLIWLCRHGFEDVAYVRRGCASPRDGADVLLVLERTSQRDLEVLLAQVHPLREGGVLVVNIDDLRSADGGPDPIHAVLQRAGYAAERCLPRRHGEIHIARRAAAIRVAA